VEIVIYLVIGLFAGLSAGLLGIGGGVIVVPALVFVFNRYVPVIPPDIVMHLAVGCSLSAMVFTTMSSSYVHYCRGSIHWQAWRRWILGLLLGGFVGALLADVTPTLALSKLFAAFLLVVAFKLFFPKKYQAHRRLPPFWAMNGVGLCFGVLSGLLGVGGGVLMVPFLLRYGLKMVVAAGTSTAASVLIATIASAGFVVTGWHASKSIPWSTGYIYWPAVLLIVPSSMLCAPIGVKLAHVMPAVLIKRIFAVILVVVAGKMMM
jgi:uncharacterized protein